MAILRIDARTLSYESTPGSSDAIAQGAPTFVLVHGSPGAGQVWSRVSAHLRGHAAILAPDLPGAGQTSEQPLEAAPSITYAAELIEALIGQVRPPVVLVGHSHGAVVALRIALRGKVALQRLVLIEPVVMRVLEVAGQHDLFAAVRDVFDGYLARVDRGEPLAITTMIDYWFGAGAFEKLPQGVRDQLANATARNARDVRAGFLERYDPAGLAAVASPCAVVVGSRSPPVMHAIVRVLAGMVSNGSLHTVEGATHALITTHAEAIAGIVAAQST